MDYPTILHAELFAITLAIEQAQVRGWSRLWVESDSKVGLGFDCPLGFE
ncbi:hypothetical protein A2U01_0088620, partial [Trifolium medium]|nr:hypothetical protein [Trifolium medium]